MKVMLQGHLTSLNLGPGNEVHVTGSSHISQHACHQQAQVMKVMMTGIM